MTVRVKDPIVKRADPPQSEGLWHVYQSRREGRVPQVGERALCGHVKKLPPAAPRYLTGASDECMVCASLAGWIR